MAAPFHGYGTILNDVPGRSAGDYASSPATTAANAAISVGVLLIVCALFLTLLKRSGFRAMVAVGRS